MGRRNRRRIVRALPPVGTKLTGRFKGITYNSKIVEDKSNASGKAVLYLGQKYRTLTAAAVAITKQPTNGWRFWKF